MSQIENANKALALKQESQQGDNDGPPLQESRQGDNDSRPLQEFQQAGIGHNRGPPLEVLARIYPDIPESRSIQGWCDAYNVHRSGWYRLPDRPEVILIGHRKIITRLATLRWLQRRHARGEVA